MNLQEPPLKKEFYHLLDRAWTEDLGAGTAGAAGEGTAGEGADRGDITGSVIFPEEIATACIYSRQNGVLSGRDCAELTFRYAATVKPEITFGAVDGAEITDGQPVMKVWARLKDFLRAERIALNFLGYFSGIAGTARTYCAALGNSKTRLLDTRKTLPAYRHLSKAAVIDGGGLNHRMGLYDMVLIKDNHIAAAGGISPAVEKIRAAWGKRYPVEVECKNLDEVEEALLLGVDRIMLDNMSYEDCRKTMKIRKRFNKEELALEASGDFTVEKIRQFADLNLDYISVGALTHSVVNHNFSMLIDRT